MGKRRAILLFLLGLVVMFCAVLSREMGRKTKTILKIAAFSGSNWDVTVQDSYVILDRAIAQFEKVHPEVQVVYDSGIPKEEYSEYLSRKIMEADAPDLFYVKNSDFDRLVRIGALEKLNPMMEGERGIDPNRYYTAFLKTGQKNQVQYALPIEGMTNMMFINESLLSKEMVRLPLEDFLFEEMYDICRRVTKDTDGDGLPDQFGVYKYDWQDAAVSAGAVMFDPNGNTVNLASGEMKQAILFMQALTELNDGQTVTQETFDAGQVAFMPLTFAEYRTYRSYPYKIKRFANFKWDCMEMPRGAKGGNYSTVDALNMGISSTSKQKELAWEFLRYLSYDPEMQTTIFKELPVISVLKQVMNSKEAESILGNQNKTLVDTKKIDAVLENGIVNPKFDGYAEVMELIDRTIKPLYQSNTGAMDLDYALRNLQRKVKEERNK